MNVAVLITCHNRKEKTKKCLEVLFNQALPEGMRLEVFLCDDGSTDGTGQMVEELFPQVKITQGSGYLYWGGGMRKAWDFAKSSGKFDFFLWLNDDTFLFENALVDLFEDYFSLALPAILIGSCIDSQRKNVTFGGYTNEELVIPNGTFQEVDIINGNLVLIPNVIDSVLKGLSPDYTHYYGDYDYGIRARKTGFKCLLARKYLAISDQNPPVAWGVSSVPLKKRLNLIHSVKGLAILEYFQFLRFYKGNFKAVKSVLFIYLRVLFPTYYKKIRHLLSIFN